MKKTKLELPSYENITLVGKGLTPRIFKHSSKWQWSTKLSNHFNLWIALKGKAHFIVDGKHHEVKKNSLFIFSPGQSIWAESTSHTPLHNYAAHFYPMSQDKALYDTSEFPVSNHQVRDIQYIEQLVQHSVYCSQFDDPLSVSQTIQDVLLILKQVHRERLTPLPAPSDERIQEIISEISADPSRPWTLDHLSERANLSTSQVARRFIALTGKSPIRYIMHARITNACLLLKETSDSIEKISDSLGYNDLYFFSKQFKQCMGIPPSHYRRQLQSSNYSSK